MIKRIDTELRAKESDLEQYGEANHFYLQVALSFINSEF